VLARSDRPEAWTTERLQQAAVDELIQHGGNQRDVQQLQAELQKAYENKSAEQQIKDHDSKPAATDIPEA
jgi:hypothetical protein